MSERKVYAEEAIAAGQLVQPGRSAATVVPVKAGSTPFGVAMHSVGPGDLVEVNLGPAVEMDPGEAARLKARMAEIAQLRRDKQEAAERASIDPERELSRLGAALDDLDV